MNTRSTLTVLLLAAGIAGYFLYFETDVFREGGPTAERVEQPEGRPLFADAPIRPEAIARIDVKTDGRMTRQLQRRDGAWMQTRPTHLPLVDARVTALLDTVAGLREHQRIGDPGDPAEYDLDPPRFELILHRAGAPAEAGDAAAADADQRTTQPTPIALQLGRTATAGRAYVRRAGSRTIHVVNDALHRRLAQGLDNLRETSLPEINPARVRRLHLSHAGQRITVERIDGGYRFTRPHRGRAAEQAVNRLIRALNQTQLERIAHAEPDAETLATYGLDAPRLRLEVQYQPTATADGAASDAAASMRTRWLEIGGQKDLTGEQHYARYSQYPLVFVLPERRLGDFRLGVDDLRDPRLTPIARTDVRRITVQRSGETDTEPIRLALRRGRWVFADDGGADSDAEARPADTQAVNALLDALFDARAEAYDTDTALPADHTTVVLETAGGEDAEILHLARPTSGVDELVTGTAPEAGSPGGAAEGDDGGGTARDGDDRQASARVKVVRGTEPVAYLVPAEPMQPVFRPAKAYRPRTVLDLTDRRVMRIAVEGGGERGAFAVTRDARDDWPTEAVDAEAVADLLAALSPLRAEAWVDQPLQAPDLTLTLTLADAEADGPAERTIRLDIDRRLGTVGGDVFRLDAATVEALAAELRDRVVLPIERAAIARIEAGGRTLRQDAAGVIRAGDMPDGAILEETRAEAKFDTLAGLKVQRYLAGDGPSGEPDFTVDVHLRTGERHRLRIWRPTAGESGPIGRVDDGRPFRLHPGDVELLRQPVVTEPGK